MKNKDCHKYVIKPFADATNAKSDEALAAQKLFVLTGEQQYDAFMAALARPAQDKPQLRRLLTEPGVLG